MHIINQSQPDSILHTPDLSTLYQRDGYIVEVHCSTEVCKVVVGIAIQLPSEF